jgi:hypothetical protein
MKKTILNGLFGVVAASAIVLSGTAAANASDFPMPTTTPGGTLTLATHQYSNSTIDVVADYSSLVHGDTEIQVTARDAATGAVVSTETMDNSICLQERVMDGFNYKHDYIFDAKLVWKDGSQRSVAADSVRQDMAYTNTVYWMKYTPLNQDLPANSIGFHNCVSITEGSYKISDNAPVASAPVAQPAKAQPTAVKGASIKQLKSTKSSVALTWKKAANVKQYQVKLQRINGKHTTKTVKVSASKGAYTIKKLPRRSFYLVTLKTVLKNGAELTVSKAIATK